MIIFVPLDRITANPWQTRQGEPDPEHVKALAMDIAANGLLQKPLGRMVVSEETDLADEMYKFDNWGSIEAMAPGVTVQLAFGHNRLAAYKFLADIKDHTNIVESYTSLPVEIRRLDNQQMADFAWSENERRRDVNSLERAIAIRKRMDDFGWTQQTAAEHTGMSRSAIANILRLLDLPQDMQENVLNGNISERVALALLPLYEMSQGLIDKAESSYSSATKPSAIIRSAMSGASSDNIRKSIEYLLDSHSKDMQEAGFGLDDKFVAEGYIVSETCRNCEWRIKSRNRCTDPQCYQAKRDDHKFAHLNMVSQATGIKVHDKPERTYSEGTDFSYAATDAQLASVIKSGCENLRLSFASYTRSHITAAIGFENVEVFCIKKNCSCLLGARNIPQQPQSEQTKKTDSEDTSGEQPEDIASAHENVCAQTSVYTPPTSEQLQEIARKARQRDREEAKQANKLKDDASTLIVFGLHQQDPKTMKLVLDQICRGTNWASRPDDIETIYEWIAKAIVKDVFGYTPDAQLRDRLGKWISENGLAKFSDKSLMTIFGNNDSEG